MNGLVRALICLSLCLSLCALSAASEKTCERPDLVRPASPPAVTGAQTQTSASWAVVCLIRHKDTGNSARNKALATYLSTYSDQHNFTILFFSEDHFTPDEIKVWSVQFAKVGPVKHVDTSNNAYWMDGVRKYGYK